MAFQEVLQHLIAVSLTVWLLVEELIYRCGPSAVSSHEPVSATSPGLGGVSLTLQTNESLDEEVQ